ncbi:MAG: hypothetical protein FJ109_00765 [Deltaproteobacteria bacterium]|nr:hypothetical protein [Deltaproteobacteria bacterium]
MLGAMRRHSKSFLIYLLFGMIIVVFVFTFNTGMGGGDGGCVSEDVPAYAKVGGHTITRDHLVMSMNLLPGFLRTPAGMSFTLAAGADAGELYRNDVEELTPKQASAILQITEMIYLASDEAIRLGFKIGEKELAKAMYPESFYKEEEVTGDDGLPTTKKVFDSRGFNNWIVYGLNSSPQEYEDFVNRVLLAFKLQSFLAGVVKVEPMEAELAVRAKNTKVDLGYVEFRPDLYELAGTVTDEEAARYAAEHEAEVSGYYDAHPAVFHADEQFQVAGIFAAAKAEEPPARGEEKAAPVPPTKEEKEAAAAKAKAMLERIQGQGDLFPMPPPAADGSQPPKPESPAEPFARFKEVAKRESAHAESPHRSGLFSGWMTLAEMEDQPFGSEGATALAGAAKDQLVGPFETEDGAWILYVTDKKERKDESLEQARNGIGRILLQQKKAPETAKARAEELLKIARAAEGTDLDKALETFKAPAEGKELGVDAILLQVKRSGKFHLATPGASIPGIGKFEELFKDAFKMTPDKPLADKVYVQPDTNRVYVVKLMEKALPEAKLSAEDIEAERENLFLTRAIPTFESWLKSLRQGAVERGQMERTEEFQSFVSYLQNRIDEKAAQEAKRAAKAAGLPIPVTPVPVPAE